MPRDKKLQRNEILKIYKERGVSYVKEEVWEAWQNTRKGRDYYQATQKTS